MGIIVAVGIFGALSIEFWTFGKMIWTGITEQESQTSTRQEETISDEFQTGKVKGTFKILSLIPNGDTWQFYCVVDLQNTGKREAIVRFKNIRLKNEDRKSLNKKFELTPGENRTVQFQRDITPGASPHKIEIGSSTGSEGSDRWINLPKIPVRAS